MLSEFKVYKAGNKPETIVIFCLFQQQYTASYSASKGGFTCFFINGFKHNFYIIIYIYLALFFGYLYQSSVETKETDSVFYLEKCWFCSGVQL